MCGADEFIGEISAAGVENTREFSQVWFQEFLDRRILAQFLNRLPSARKARLLLYRWNSAWNPAFRPLNSCNLTAEPHALFRREEL